MIHFLPPAEPVVALLFAAWMLLSPWLWLLGSLWILRIVLYHSRRWRLWMRVSLGALVVAIGCAPDIVVAVALPWFDFEDAPACSKGAIDYFFRYGILPMFGPLPTRVLCAWLVFGAIGLAAAYAREISASEARPELPFPRHAGDHTPKPTLDRASLAGIVSWLAFGFVTPVIWASWARGPGTPISWVASGTLKAFWFHGWASLPDSLVTVFLVALPVEFAAARLRLPIVRLMARCGAWLTVSTAFVGSADFLAHTSSSVAIATGSCVASWVMRRLRRPYSGPAWSPKRSSIVPSVLAAIWIVALGIYLIVSGTYIAPHDVVAIQNRSGAAIFDVELSVGKEAFRYDSIANGEFRRASSTHLVGDAEYLLRWRAPSGTAYRLRMAGDCFGDSFSEVTLEVPTEQGKPRIWSLGCVCFCPGLATFGSCDLGASAHDPGGEPCGN